VNGPLSVSVKAVHPVHSTDPKLQSDITKRIVYHRAKDLALRHKAFDKENRRRISFENRHPSTMAFVSTAPATASQVLQAVFTGAVALVAGAPDPYGADCNGLMHRKH